MPNDIGSAPEEVRGKQSFDEDYYRHGCGPDPYERNETWRGFYAQIVEHIVRSLAPRTVLDAGCALGMMVEAFWDRGTEASGIDISQYAIDNVRPDMREHCRVASLVDTIPGRYDLVTCIEVLEHIPPQGAESAAGNMAAVCDTILFSSSPYDFNEITHVNVRPTLAWIRLFGQFGLWPDLLYDASFILPHAMLLRRIEAPSDAVLVLFVEKLRLLHELNTAKTRVQSLTTALQAATARHADYQLEAATLQASVRTIEGELKTQQTALRGATEALASSRNEAAESVARMRQEHAHALSGLQETVRLALAEAQRRTADASASRKEATLAVNRARQEAAVALAVKTGELEQLSHRTAEQQTEIGVLHEGLQLALRQAEQTSHQLFLIQSSATWRTTAGLRTVFARLPAFVRPRLRRAAKAAWWLATPHKIPLRLQHRNVTKAALPSALVPLTPSSPSASDSWRAIHHHQIAGSADRGAEARLPQARDLLAESPLFDTAWYRERYCEQADRDFDAVQHYLEVGAAQGYDPGPQFSTSRYLARYPDVQKAGLNALAHYEQYGRKEGLETSWSRVAVVTTADVVDACLVHVRPLPLFEVARSLLPKVTLVTDSTAASHFYGGVGTATIMAALWARRRGAALSIATLRAEPVRESVSDLLRTLGVEAPIDIEFRRSDILATNRPLDVGSEDVFLTTSWWSTLNVLGSVPVERVVYILQEDERMFYPAGDDQLRASEAMNVENLRRVINTRLLYDFLATSGVRGLDSHGKWFEPAFPSQVYFRGTGTGKKMNLFFYARPNNSRNLYLRGLEVINRAVVDGVLRPDDWNIHFVGKDLQPVAIPGGQAVHLAENLSWTRYLDLVRRMDLGLSLMMTPHPSYPPLDLVACGAVAVTNTFGPKTSLAAYSGNLLCAEPSVDALVQALASGVALTRNEAVRHANYERQTMRRPWIESFKPVLDWLEAV